MPSPDDDSHSDHSHSDHSHSDHSSPMSAKDWDAEYTGTDEPGPDPFVAAQCADGTGSTALDLGCGSGANAVLLASRGWSVTGVDWSPRAVAAAQRTATEHGVVVDFLVDDITTWKPSRRYDLVLSSYALPTGRQREALATAVSAVAPGGTLLVLELDPELSARWAVGDDEAFTPETIASELRGLVIERSEVIAIDRGPGYDPKGHDHGRSVVVRASRPPEPEEGATSARRAVDPAE